MFTDVFSEPVSAPSATKEVCVARPPSARELLSNLERA